MPKKIIYRNSKKLAEQKALEEERNKEMNKILSSSNPKLKPKFGGRFSIKKND